MSSLPEVSEFIPGFFYYHPVPFFIVTGLIYFGIALSCYRGFNVAIHIFGEQMGI